MPIINFIGIFYSKKGEFPYSLKFNMNIFVKMIIMKTKKTLFTGVAAVLLLSSVYSCMISIGTGMGTVSTTTTTTATVTALSKHMITAGQARLLSDEYTNQNYKILNAGKRDPETKEVYYDIEVLQDYINYVKSEAKKNKIKDVGITIAFGQYPNNGSFDNRLKKEYQGKQTVYLKATSKSESTKVGMGGSIRDADQSKLDQIGAFDFGQLTPPER